MSQLAFRFLFFSALTFLIFSPSLLTFFYADDFDWLYTANQVGRGQLPFWEPVGRSRPFFLLLFSGLFKLFGLRPTPYHLLAFLIHAANVTALFFLASELKTKRGLSPFFPYLSALFFLLFPLHYQPTVWIIYLQDQLALLCAFPFLSLAGKRKRLLAFCFYFLSLGFKEHIFSLPFLMPFYAFCQTGKWEKRDWLFACFPCFPFLAYLFLYHSLPLKLSFPASPFEAQPHLSFHLLFSYASFLEKALFFLLGFFDLPGFYTFSPLALALRIFFPLLSFLFFALLFHMPQLFSLLQSKKHFLSFFFLFFLLSLFPASLLPYSQTKTGAFFASFRYFYFADIGLCLALGLILSSFPKGWGMLLSLTYAFSLLIFSFLSLLIFQSYHSLLGKETQAFFLSLEKCSEKIALVSFPESILIRHRNHLPYLVALKQNKKKEEIQIFFNTEPPHACIVPFEKWQKLFHKPWHRKQK